MTEHIYHNYNGMRKLASLAFAALLLFSCTKENTTPELQAQYDKLPHHAGECTHCGACLSRCPFGVDIPKKMDKAKEVFGK